MTSQHMIKPFGLRIPPDLKSWIDEHAKTNGRSLNSEIVQLIKAAKQASESQ